jgi:hypothetical protein
MAAGVRPPIFRRFLWERKDCREWQRSIFGTTVSSVQIPPNEQATTEEVALSRDIRFWLKGLIRGRDWKLFQRCTKLAVL